MSTTPKQFDVITAEQPTHSTAMVLSPVMNLQEAKRRLVEFQSFVREYMIPGLDYGLIPGVEKPSLWQPGADKLIELYGLAPSFPEDRIRRVEDWDAGLFFYEVTCVLHKKGTASAENPKGLFCYEAKGSCSSYESKYRYRLADLKCPACQKEGTVIKGKEQYGGGWVCFNRKGGCGQKWKDGEKAIEGQVRGKVQNKDIADVMNTVLQMAQKRAKVAAAKGVSPSAGSYFTMGAEDNNGASVDDSEKRPGQERSAETLIEGILTDAKEAKGDFWLIVTQGKESTTCVVRSGQQDVIRGLAGAMGEQVELTGKKCKAKQGIFYEIISIGSVGEPETDDEIPFGRAADLPENLQRHQVESTQETAARFVENNFMRPGDRQSRVNQSNMEQMRGDSPKSHPPAEQAGVTAETGPHTDSGRTSQGGNLPDLKLRFD